MMHRISILKDANRTCADFVGVVTLFKTMEIIPTPFKLQDRVLMQLDQCCREAEVVSLSIPGAHVLPSDEARVGSEMVLDAPATVAPLASFGGLGSGTGSIDGNLQPCIAALQNRVVEHNIRVLSCYYGQIRTARAAEMLSLSVDVLETHLAEMSLLASSFSAEAKGGSKNVKKAEEVSTTEEEESGKGGTALYIRINRPAGIVSFQRPHSPESTLSEWAHGITGLLDLMETTCHLINRENMVYKV
jgi:hypothetical protein